MNHTNLSLTEESSTHPSNILPFSMSGSNRNSTTFLHHRTWCIRFRN